MSATNPATVYLSKWPQRSDTFKTMYQALEAIVDVQASRAQLEESEAGVTVEIFPWHELRYESVRGISAKLKDTGAAVPTINKSLVALRGVLESAWRSGLIPDEDYRRIEIKNLRGKSAAAGRALSAGEMDVVRLSLEQARPQEAALIALLSATGIRRVEVVRLLKEDLDLRAGRLNARGKGDKVRSIPIAPRWLPLITPWWSELEPRAFAFTEFHSKKSMSRRTVSYIIETFCTEFDLPRFTPHDLRRTFATRICEQADIGIASKLLGHSSIDTTRIYDRRGDEAEDAAVKDI